MKQIYRFTTYHISSAKTKDARRVGLVKLNGSTRQTQRLRCARLSVSLYHVVTPTVVSLTIQGEPRTRARRVIVIQRVTTVSHVNYQFTVLEYNYKQMKTKLKAARPCIICYSDLVFNDTSRAFVLASLCSLAWGMAEQQAIYYLHIIIILLYYQ